MGKIGLIIQREYLTRVRKRSFILLTILGPLLMAGVAIVPIWLANANETIRTVAVLDETGVVDYQLKSNENIQFQYTHGKLADAKKAMENSSTYALVYIPGEEGDNLMTTQNNIKLYSKEQVSLNVKIYIENQIEKQIERAMLKSSGVDKDLVSSIEKTVKVSIKNISLSEKGKSDTSNNVEISTILGGISGFLIYFFIFFFGAQVMRGVIEEKNNRIVELIISSVKPFQLMMGKIIGIAMVGLTQFLLWVILTASIYSVFMNTVVKEKFSAEKIEMLKAKSPDGTAVEDIDQMADMNKMVDGINSVNWALIIPCFIFYFLGGYLLYGAMFAAVGGAVDTDSDTQQFILPITIPLIFSFIMAQTVLNDPTGVMARWLSIIPLTSPIIMMVRLPFQVPVWELILSMVMMIVGFVFTTWLAGKIYRTGILMYGKRVTWREMARWLRY
ncbi:MAG TPA: ABC transporter permease [Flavobacteriales bacterium]|nr:ABC transporter permease [Flavobacteriales bacterium]HPH83183.1 ABC transporter permease [Flavobacteriales bacterium]